ncbi:MAG: hypothetical protein OEN50_10450 [Deltaproteobacteria bacterium]|nr:hypothetical protein [Deltaproteobacteria bacterium]
MVSDKKDSDPQSEVIKKPYHAPEFFTYGDIREITKAIGMNGASDGGGGGNMNTAI